MLSQASSAVLMHRHAVCRQSGVPWQDFGCCLSYTQTTASERPVSAIEPSRASVAICALWVTPVERTRGVAVLRVSLCG